MQDLDDATIERAEIWASAYQIENLTEADSRARDVLTAFYLVVLRSLVVGRPAYAVTGLAHSLLTRLLNDGNDPSVVAPDGDVDPDSLLYAFLDRLMSWQESEQPRRAAVAQRGRDSFDALVSSGEAPRLLGIHERLLDVTSSSGSVAPGRTRKPSVGDPSHLLAQMIGLASVKEAIFAEAEVQRVDAERRRRGMAPQQPTRHMVFTGNPGTGKTTVARLVATMYYQAGILERDHLVEVSALDMMGPFQGQNSQKAKDVITSAIGGVLLVDEAYALNGTGDSGPMDFAQQVIDTLVKEMEDHRDNLVVILTGYPAPMERFLRTNPGLASRFGENVQFPDYSPDELVEVFHLMCVERGLSASEDAVQEVRIVASEAERGESFGNARLVRNLIDEAFEGLALRLEGLDLSTVTADQLSILQTIDIQRAGRALARPRLTRNPVGFSA